MGLGALMISTGLVLPGTLDVGWTTPQPIKAFLSASGSWETAISVCFVFIICVLIYLHLLPWRINNRLINRKELCYETIS